MFISIDDGCVRFLTLTKAVSQSLLQSIQASECYILCDYLWYKKNGGTGRGRCCVSGSKINGNTAQPTHQ